MHLHSRRARIAVLASALMAFSAACSGGATTGPSTADSRAQSPAAQSSGAQSSGAQSSGAQLPGAESPGAGDWESVLTAAKGQTVDWYMYGGDDTVNTFVTGYLADRAAAVGVTLNQVRIADTVDAVDKVLGEVQAGRSADGSVDLIWINGENFGTGVQADLWLCGWDRTLPNAEFVDFADPAVATDFGTPVDGCEAVWQQADSALVYDSAALDPADVVSVSSLFDWARSHPGRFTYPAPPDFTGSMAVRTMLYDSIGGPQTLTGAFDESAYVTATASFWPRLIDIADSLWRGGETYPTSQSAVEKLYSDGEISAYFTYGPGAVGEQVDNGLYPTTTREAVLAGGNIGNRSFLAIPANAADQAGAKVVANLLQDPQTQLELYRSTGIYPGIDVTRTSPEVQAEFAAVPVHPSVLPLVALTADVQPELGAAYLTRIEQDWIGKVLQRQ